MKKLALSVALTGMFVWQANAILAYTTPTGLAGTQQGGVYALGDVFTISSAITVDALGAFTPNGIFSSPIDVAIYSVTMNGNSIQGSALVTPVVSFDGTYAPGTALQTIANTVLGPGTYMVVANNYGVGGGAVDYNPAWDPANGASPGNPSDAGSNPLVAANGLTFSLTGYFTETGTLTGGFPTTFGADPFWTLGGPHYGAGNFDFVPVPEAAGFTMAGIALLGLVYVGRAYSQKLKLT